jgi:DNA-binding CsgD family transcriptional regulator
MNREQKARLELFLAEIVRLISVQRSQIAVDRLETALSELPPRQRDVLVERRLVSKRKTLDELGQILGVTRERVRQIERRAENKLRSLGLDFEWPFGDRLVRIAEAVEYLGGSPDVVAEIRDGTNAASGEAVGIRAYIYLAGVSVATGYVGSGPAWAHLEAALTQLDGFNSAALPLIRRKLERLIPNITSEELAILLSDRGIRLSTGEVRRSEGTNLDRVKAAFATAGRSLSKAEVAQATGLSQRQVSAVLGRGEEFDWVGRGLFAPADWRLPPYAGTEQALADELRYRGGAAGVSELIAAVQMKFGCTSSSCQIYL